MKKSLLYLLLTIILLSCYEVTDTKYGNENNEEKSESDQIKEKRINFKLNIDEPVNLVVVLNENEAVNFETQKINTTVFVSGDSYQNAVAKLNKYGAGRYKTVYVGAHLRSENPDCITRYYLSPKINVGALELTNYNQSIDNVDSVDNEIKAMNYLFNSVVRNGQVIFAYCDLANQKVMFDELNIMIQNNQSLANRVKFYVSSGQSNTAIYRSTLFENKFETIAFYPLPHSLHKGEDAIRVNVPSKRGRGYYYNGFMILEKGKEIVKLATDIYSGDLNVDFEQDVIMFPEKN
jgi:hypothetical protein